MEDILKAPLWQKLLAAVVVIGFALWLFNGYFIAPKVSEINRLKATLRDMQAEIDTIAPKDVIIKEGLDIRDIIKKQLEDLMKKIPTEQEVPFIIDDLISEVGTGLSIDYRLIQPGAIQPEDRYLRLPLTLNFVSDFTDLNLYLKQLKNLPTTIRIDTLSLNKTETTPKLLVNMTLSAFVMPGTPLVSEVKTETQMKPYLFDPFYRYITVKGGEKVVPTIVLQGIWKGHEVKALINDQELGLGDTIQGYRVVEIGKNSVTVIKEGSRTTLNLGGGK